VIVDFHCHSDCSDGQLSVVGLIKAAEERMVQMLSITDHDTLDAYNQKIKTPIKIITGIEFSTQWNKISIHVVGLNIDVTSKHLQELVTAQKLLRSKRAEIIAKRLEKHGLENALELIKRNNQGTYIGRPDFAKLLVNQGICTDINQAFKKYLGAGKIGDVKNQWQKLDEIIFAIKQAGGVAVLAHPLYYKLTNSKLRRLLTDFKNLGGVGIEVVNGYQNPDKTDYLAQLCEEFGFKASIGSDFHGHKQWNKLGCDSRLITGLPTVWDKF
jgi:predicted metal-dependent phosphoesterase TrpH